MTDCDDAMWALIEYARKNPAGRATSPRKVNARLERKRAYAKWLPAERYLVAEARRVAIPVDKIASGLKRKESEIEAVIANSAGNSVRWVSPTGQVEWLTQQSADARIAEGLGPLSKPSPPVNLTQASTAPENAPGAHAPTGEPLSRIPDLHLPAHDWLIDD
jgi:hypothetical protein